MGEQSKANTYDVSKYQTVTTDEKVTVTIDETGDTFEVTVKPMSWSKRNQLVSKCLKFTQNGQTSFQGDLYIREALKETIIDAPWGRTTEAFLMSIDERLGDALEKLVPTAFGGDTGGSPEQIKKE